MKALVGDDDKRWELLEEKLSGSDWVVSRALSVVPAALTTVTGV